MDLRGLGSMIVGMMILAAIGGGLLAFAVHWLFGHLSISMGWR